MLSPHRAAAADARLVVAVPAGGSVDRIRALASALRPQLSDHRADPYGGVVVLVAEARADQVIARTMRQYLGDTPAAVLHVPPADAPDDANTPVPPAPSRLRNALLRAASRVAPQHRYVIWLDDSCRPQPGWFEAMAAALAATSDSSPTPGDLRLVAGPVHEAVPGRSPRHVRPVLARAPFAREQDVHALRRVRNLAVPRAVLDAMESSGSGVWFPENSDPAAAEYEFLTRARRVGARLVWAPQAAVGVALAPGARASLGRLAEAYRLDRAGALVECRSEGPGVSARIAAEVCRRAVADTGSALLARDPDTSWRATEGVARGLGRLGGLVAGTSRLLGERARALPELVASRPTLTRTPATD